MAALAEHGGGKIAEPRAAMLAAFLLPLADALPAATPADLPALWEALRALLLLALRPAPASGERGARPGAPLRSRVEEVIARNISSARLDVMRISELSGVSRTTLYRLFETEGGVAGYVQRLRLELVRKDLGDPGLMEVPIARLAERRGLYCAASFNRAFRRTFGATPGQVRAGRPGQPQADGPPHEKESVSAT